MGAGSDFVLNHYHSEENEMLEKSFSVPFSVRFDGITAAIIDGLCVRFGTTRNAVIREMIKQNALEAMKALTAADRLIVANEGEKAYAEFLSKNPNVRDSGGALTRIAEHMNLVESLEQEDKK